MSEIDDLPTLYDMTVLDDEPHIPTQIYDQPLKQPAESLWSRYRITAACLLNAGIPVDLIAISIAAGCRWEIGPAVLAESHTVIWLLDLSIPYERQIAAWWVGGPR